MAKFKLITIGVYGWDETAFFAALSNAGVDLFVDIRQRRGMRGPKYAFANSTALQNRLAQMGISYMRAKTLAPTLQLRSLQKQIDKQVSVAKQSRAALGADFIRLYQQQILSPATLEDFVERIENQVKIIALFCVERRPEACHRSIVAQELARRYQVHVEHLLP